MANEENPAVLSNINDAVNECPKATTFTETSLTIDYSLCPSWTDSLKEACDVVNGKLWQFFH